MTKEELKPLIAIVLKQLMARQCTALKECYTDKEVDEEMESAINDALTLILGYLPEDSPNVTISGHGIITTVPDNLKPPFKVTCKSN